MLPEYTVDYEVFLRPAERNENETALQRVSRVTENARYQKAAEALEQIRSQRLIPLTMRPELYFWFEKKTQTLHCLGTGIKLKYTDGCLKNPLAFQNLFTFYYYGIPGGVAYDVFQYILSYLTACQFTPYHRALMKLKCCINCLSIPLFEQIGNVWIVDEVLCYNDTRGMYIPITKTSILQHIRNYYPYYNDPIIKQLDENLGALQSLIRELKKIVPDERCITSSETPKIGYIYKSSPMLAHYIPTLGKAVLERENGMPSLLPTKRIFLETSLEHCVLTNHLKGFLHLLSRENTEVLESICELFARMLSNDLPSRYVWVICGDRTSINYFLELLLSVTGGLSYEGVYALRKQTNEQNIREDILTASLNRIFFYYNSSPRQDISKMNHSLLPKVVSGESFADMDDPLLTAPIATTAVLLYATERPAEVVIPDLKRLPYKILSLDDRLADFTLNGEERDWLRTKLALYGLALLERNGPVRSEKEELSTDELLEKLIEDFSYHFCKKERGGYVTNKSLCAAFKEYNDSLPAPLKVPGSTTFKNILCKTLGVVCKVERNTGNILTYQDFVFDEQACQKKIKENLQKKERQKQQGAEAAFNNLLKEIDQIADVSSQVNCRPTKTSLRVRVINNGE